MDEPQATGHQRLGQRQKIAAVRPQRWLRGDKGRLVHSHKMGVLKEDARAFQRCRRCRATSRRFFQDEKNLLVQPHRARGRLDTLAVDPHAATLQHPPRLAPRNIARARQKAIEPVPHIRRANAKSQPLHAASSRPRRCQLEEEDDEEDEPDEDDE